MANCWFCYQDAEGGEYHPKCAKRFFGTANAPVVALNAHILKELAEKTVSRRLALTGVQPKLSVSLEKATESSRLTIAGLWGEYILKPQHGRYSQMPEIEDLTMHLASLFKIAVCKHTLLRAADKSLVYLAKRFDRVKGRKVHLEDFCQLSEFLTEQKYKGSYEKAGKLVLRHCTNAGLDAIRYFEVVLFSYLSGNNDMHLKNFSLLHGGSGITLSPAYDLLNVNLVNPQDDEDLGLTLNGKKKRIVLDDFIRLAETLQISPEVCSNIFKRFRGKNKQVKELIDRSFLIEKSKEAYWNIWNDKQQVFAR